MVKQSEQLTTLDYAPPEKRQWRRWVVFVALAIVAVIAYRPVRMAYRYAEGVQNRWAMRQALEACLAFDSRSEATPVVNRPGYENDEGTRLWFKFKNDLHAAGGLGSGVAGDRIAFLGELKSQSGERRLVIAGYHFGIGPELVTEVWSIGNGSNLPQRLSGHSLKVLVPDVKNSLAIQRGYRTDSNQIVIPLESEGKQVQIHGMIGTDDFIRWTGPGWMSDQRVSGFERAETWMIASRDNALIDVQTAGTFQKTTDKPKWTDPERSTIGGRTAVFTAGNPGRVTIQSDENAKPLEFIVSGDQRDGGYIALSPDGDRLFIALGSEWRIYDAMSGTQLRQLEWYDRGSYLHRAQWSSDSRFIAIGGYSYVYLWVPEPESVIYRLPGISHSAHDVQLSGDNRTLRVHAWTGNRTLAWDIDRIVLQP